MTRRRQLLEVLSEEARTASSLAREMGLDRRDVEHELRHMIRSARAGGHQVIVDPAACRTCGFLFDDDRITRPGRCPACRGSRIYEPRIRIRREGEA